MNETLLRSKKIGELRELAKAAGVPAYYKCKKEELIEKLLALAEAGYASEETAAESPREEALAAPAEEAAEPAPVEPEPAKPSVTLEQIQQKVVKLAAAGKKAEVREIVTTYGAKVSDLKDQPEKWDEVWGKLTALEG
jgi:hypothetical protein